MTIHYLEIMGNIVLASFGGIVKRLSDFEKSKEKVSASYYVIGSFTSMFAGVVVYFLCKNFEVPQFLTAGLTAISGYIGVPALDLLSDIAKKRVKAQTGIEEK